MVMTRTTGCARIHVSMARYYTVRGARRGIPARPSPSAPPPVRRELGPTKPQQAADVRRVPARRCPLPSEKRLITARSRRRRSSPASGDVRVPRRACGREWPACVRAWRGTFTDGKAPQPNPLDAILGGSALRSTGRVETASSGGQGAAPATRRARLRRQKPPASEVAPARECVRLRRVRVGVRHSAHERRARPLLPPPRPPPPRAGGHGRLPRSPSPTSTGAAHGSPSATRASSTTCTAS